MESRPARATGLRFLLGMLQMFGAVAGLTLFVMTGLSFATVMTVAATSALSLTSRMVYRRPSDTKLKGL